MISDRGDAVPDDVAYEVSAADPVEDAIDRLIEVDIRAAEQRDRRHLSPVGGEPEAPRKPTRAPVAPHGHGLYVGDLFSAGKALVHANYELYALRRQYTMTPEVAAAIDEMAASTSALVDLVKWTANRLRGIDWVDRPELRGLAVVPVGEKVVSQ